MKKTPLINAMLAIIYIIIIALILFYGTIFEVGNNSIIAPIAMISLFTFSAAVMGFLFLYQPFILYFDGKKKQALDYFFKTLILFGIITLLILFILFSGILK